MEMEMRAVEDTAMAQDLIPPLPPLAFSLYDSCLSSHCSACSLPLPTPPFTPTFPPNYSRVPTAADASTLLYCSPLCSSFDYPLHFSSAEHHLLQSLPATSHPDSANLRLSLRLLHLFTEEQEFSLERIGGLMTNYRRIVKSEEDENEDDEGWRMIKEGARDMVLARRMRDGSDSGEEAALMEEAVMCLVMTNAVEVQEKNGRAIGIAVYDTTFSWINHSCSPNACYRFSSVRPEIRGELRLLILPATMDDGCGAELLSNTRTHHKFKLLQGNGPRIIVRSIKGIKKGEEVTIAYTDLLQPKVTRQSELWLKYRFSCCCKRCRAMPATYVDRVLQETSVHKEEEIEKVKDWFDDAIAEYLSFSNPESCCKKLENMLAHGHVNEQLELKYRETQLNLLHHLSLDAYTTLASAYKVSACDLLALDPENGKHQVEGFNKSRASAAYSLLLAVVTHHLFLSESSLIASAANYWGSAGESLISVARSSVGESIFTSVPAVSESPSFLNHECYRSPQLKRFLANSFCSQLQIVEFEEVCKQFQNCIADSITKTWSFLTHEGSFLKQINDLDFSRFFTMKEPSDSEVILTIGNSKRKRNVSGSESECSHQWRGILFQLGIHCLVYGAFLSSICHGQHSELARNAMNFLHSEGIIELQLCVRHHNNFMHYSA